MFSADRIRALIEQALPDCTAVVEDPMNDGSHFQARVVSSAFEGLNRVRQHQLVYGALGDIERVSHDLSALIQNISTQARQQSTAATDISVSMNAIQEITSQTSQGASQTADSIGYLAQLASDLRRSVAHFKLPG